MKQSYEDKLGVENKGFRTFVTLSHFPYIKAKRLFLSFTKNVYIFFTFIGAVTKEQNPKVLITRRLLMNERFKYGLDRCDNTISTSEKLIVRKLVVAVRKAGGLAPKFVSPGWDGVPDRILLFPGRCIGFVELKAPGKAMRPLQIRRKEQLERLGFPVYCVDSIDQIDEVVDEIKRGGDAR